MSDTNNNVGTNLVPAKLKDDVHFDLAPAAGTDTFGAYTGQNYDLAAISAIVLALAPLYNEDGSAFVAADSIIEVEVDLKPLNGRGVNEGLAANGISMATTATATYTNNNGVTVLDAGGGRNDGEERITVLPTSFSNLFVENGSIVTVHVTFQKA